MLNFLLLIGPQIEKSVLDTEAAFRIVFIFSLSLCFSVVLYSREREQASNHENNSNLL